MGELSDYLVEHDANFRKARLPALYSDFRPQKTLNPDGYRANVSAWRGALARLALSGRLSRHGPGSSLLVLDPEVSLLRSLESRQYGQPLALGTAIREASADREFLPLNDFLHSTQSIYQRTWSELPWTAMNWALRQIGVTGGTRGEDKLPRGRYVIVENLEAAGKALCDKLADSSTRFSRVFTKRQFQSDVLSNLIGGQRFPEKDVDLLLKFLSRDKGLVDYDEHTIRVKGAGEPDGITEEDSTIASIKELTASLKHQTELLNVRIDELNQQAKDAVTRKNRVTALAALKSKKLAESSLSKRYATLNQLEEVAAKIEQASDQVQLVNIMESSAGVLTTLNSQIGGVDRVDAVMDRLREQMGDTDEVAAILAESMGAPIDETEIDDELEALEKEETMKEEEARQRQQEKDAAAEAERARKELDSLPSVPADLEQSRTPTSETGITNLTLEEHPHEKTAQEAR
ncbi:hypothetical protein HIM_00899 [Hirsutella minnesotensis 3608]|nr:hypothetical protein HIM_00899 [Hirsutella minnesotensis 3608]